MEEVGEVCAHRPAPQMYAVLIIGADVNGSHTLLARSGSKI